MCLLKLACIIYEEAVTLCATLKSFKSCVLTDSRVRWTLVSRRVRVER